MPCSDGSCDHKQPNTGLVNPYDFPPPKLPNKNTPEIHYSEPTRDNPLSYEGMKKRQNYLEAIICALVNEIEEMGENYEHVIKDAEKSGKVNIQAFLKEHKYRDKQRIKEKLLEFSDHEINLIKQIVNEGL